MKQSTSTEYRHGTLTVDRIIELEPQVQIVLEPARREARGKTGCQRLQLYSAYKRAVTRLVGFERRHPILGTCDAYDRVMDRLIEVLQV